MLEPVFTINAFHNMTLEEYPFKTPGRFLIHKELVNEIYDWARETELDGIYLAEKSLEKGTLTCAFAFKTEIELGIFNLTFYNRIIEDSKTTRLYRLTRMVEQVEAATGKKISEI